MKKQPDVPVYTIIFCVSCLIQRLRVQSTLHAHTKVQFPAKHLGRAGPVWQMLYNQNGNESILSSHNFYSLSELPAPVFSCYEEILQQHVME